MSQQNQNSQEQQQQIHDENIARVNAIITTLADAPHSGEKETALHQLRDLKKAMLEQQDQLSIAA